MKLKYDGVKTRTWRKVNLVGNLYGSSSIFECLKYTHTFSHFDIMEHNHVQPRIVSPDSQSKQTSFLIKI